jgi:putative Mn2+ efflux pump MntP
MNALSVWHWLAAVAIACIAAWLVVRYLQLWAAAKAPAKDRGDWLFLFAFCFCLGFLLAMLLAAGVTVAMAFPDAVLAKSIASLFCVAARMKNPLDS